jgi:hypothetical protein
VSEGGKEGGREDGSRPVTNHSCHVLVPCPCCVFSFNRPIPSAPWFVAPAFIIPMSGILPFGSIFIEMYFVFTSFWSYKFYYVYGFMLLVYFILVMVTICTTIVAIYFVLNSENYHWQWISFMSSGSTAAYVFLYSVYYFFYKTQMTGFLQIAFYFGYMYVTNLTACCRLSIKQPRDVSYLTLHSLCCAGFCFAFHSSLCAERWECLALGSLCVKFTAT